MVTLGDVEAIAGLIASDQAPRGERPSTKNEVQSGDEGNSADGAEEGEEGEEESHEEDEEVRDIRDPEDDGDGHSETAEAPMLDDDDDDLPIGATARCALCMMTDVDDDPGQASSKVVFSQSNNRGWGDHVRQLRRVRTLPTRCPRTLRDDCEACLES